MCTVRFSDSPIFLPSIHVADQKAMGCPSGCEQLLNVVTRVETGAAQFRLLLPIPLEGSFVNPRDARAGVSPVASPRDSPSQAELLRDLITGFSAAITPEGQPLAPRSGAWIHGRDLGSEWRHENARWNLPRPVTPGLHFVNLSMQCSKDYIILQPTPPRQPWRVSYLHGLYR